MRKGLLASFVVLASISLPGFFSASDVSGTWDLTVVSQQDTANPSVSLVQAGEKLSGTYRGRMGEHKLEGTVRGSEIRFVVTMRFQDQTFLVTYSGTAEEDSMKGTVQFGDRGSGTWSAKRRSS